MNHGRVDLGDFLKVKIEQVGTMEEEGAEEGGVAQALTTTQAETMQ